MILASLTGALLASVCVPVEGERILAADLAKAEPAFAALPAEVPLGYAPSPGARRVFRRAELLHLGERYRLHLPPGEDVCVDVPMAPLKVDGLLAAMRKSLGGLDARIEILDYSRFPAPGGEIEFQLGSLARPPAGEPTEPVIWKGAVRYNGNRRFPVWARVRVLAALSRIVATTDLPTGRPIEKKDLRVETYEGFPAGGSESAVVESVAGRVPRQHIRAGTAVRSAILDEPKDVARGDFVRVEARSGAASIAFNGRAVSAGSAGDMIRVRNLATGRDFSAKVGGKGWVTDGAPREATR